MSKLTGIEQTLVDILRIESITGKERALADYVEKRAKDTALKVSGLKVERLGNSVIVLTAHDHLKSTVGLVGHLDTVPGKGFGDDVHVLEDRIVGLGASDMKAGIAVMLDLLNAEVLSKSRHNLHFVFYEGEEEGYAENGIHPVLDKFKELTKINLAFVLEPTNLALHLGCMGSLHAKLTFHGKRAHSGRPWEGRNAIYEALPLMQKVASIRPREVSIDGLIFREVLSLTQAQAGIARNIIPERFELNLNLRFPPGVGEAEAKGKILELVNGAATVEFVDYCPCGDVPIGNKLLKEFEDRFKIQREPKQAFTDVATLSAIGIPAVNFGPGLTAQAHQVGEYVLRADLRKGLEVLSGFICG